MRSIIIFFICFSFTLHAQEKQGRVMRPNSRGLGKCSVIGQAPIKVIYALNANDISDEHTYLDSQVLLIGKGLSKLYSRFLELNDSLHDDFIILLSAKHSVLHLNSLTHCSLDDFMLVTSPLFVFCYPWR